MAQREANLSAAERRAAHLWWPRRDLLMNRQLHLVAPALDGAPHQQLVVPQPVEVARVERDTTFDGRVDGGDTFALV